MAYTPHLKIKPQVLVEAAVEALDEKLVISNTVTKRADAKTFYAAQGDTITQRVKGSLPVREYAPRNDRSEPIVTDTYSEQTVNVTISQTRPYSAIKLTDEQKDWDFQQGWGDITEAQTSAIGEHLELQVLNKILTAPYERKILIDTTSAARKASVEEGEDPFFNAIVDAKSALRKMRNPDQNLTCVVGLALADMLVKSNKLIKNHGVGDNALANDSIGTIAGVNFVPSVFVPEDQAFLYSASAFMVFTGVASIPNSVPFGATASANGWALRWLMDYDTGYLTDRSVFDTFAGYSIVKDRLKMYDSQGIGHTGTEEFFVRGVQLGVKGGSLGSVDKAPGDGSVDTAGGNPESWLGKAFNGQRISAPALPAGEPWPLGGNFPEEGVTP